MLDSFRLKLSTFRQKLQKNSFRKIQILSFVLILLVLPLTVALVKIQTQSTSRAAQTPGNGGGKPDIIVVMVDDLGAIDERILERLPNIKSLFLDNGLRFDSAYSQTPLCCPGRATFLTGQNTRTHGVTRNDPRLLNPKFTIATALQDAGYYTIMAGKYLNHADKLSDKTPPGWDKVAMAYSAQAGTNNPSYWYVQGRSVKKGYKDRFVVDRAFSWLKQAPADRPVFMWLTPTAPHWSGSVSRPWIPAVETKYKSDPRCNGITPWKPASYKYAKRPNGFPLDEICRSLLTVDDMVRILRAEVEREGRNPIWVFTTDNGMAWGRDGFPIKNVPQAGKVQLYFSDPGISPGVTSALVSNIDLGPTLAELAGTTMPKAHGISFVSVLRGANNFREWILEDHPLGGYAAGPVSRSGSWWGVRTPEWHLVEWPKWRGEALYHLPGDPWEINNVASSYPEKVKELKDLGKDLVGKRSSSDDIQLNDLVDIDDPE